MKVIGYLMNNAYVFVVCLPTMLFYLDRVVIPAEEAFLAASHGTQYAQFLETVLMLYVVVFEHELY